MAWNHPCSLAGNVHPGSRQSSPMADQSQGLCLPLLPSSGPVSAGALWAAWQGQLGQLWACGGSQVAPSSPTASGFLLALPGASIPACLGSSSLIPQGWDTSLVLQPPPALPPAQDFGWEVSALPSGRVGLALSPLSSCRGHSGRSLFFTELWEGAGLAQGTRIHGCGSRRDIWGWEHHWEDPSCARGGSGGWQGQNGITRGDLGWVRKCRRLGLGMRSQE